MSTIQVFTIDHNQDTVKICGFSSLESATSTVCPDGMSRDIVRSREDLGELSEDVLLRTYNFKKTGKALTSLGRNRKRVEAGLWALLQHKDEATVDEENGNDSELTSSSEDGTKAAVGNGADESEEAPVAKRKSTKKAKAVKAERKVKRASSGPRGDKTLAVKKLLLRKNGCTRKEILEMTGWPSISVQAISRNCKLKLRKEKVAGEPTKYFGTEAA
jgi:hypothetical protein